MILYELRRKNGIEVGLAFTGAVALGGLLVLTQFMSLGLLTLAAVDGALGGYTLRFRQEKAKLQFPPNAHDTPRISNETSQETKKTPNTEKP